MRVCYTSPMRILVLSLAVSAASIACGGSTTDSPVGAADTGTGDTLTTNDTGFVADTGTAADTAATDSGIADTDAGAKCTALELGPSVTVMAVAEAAQALKGGTIVDGTYVLTSATDYLGPGGATGPRGTLQRTARYSSGKFEFIRKDMGAAVEVGSGTFAITDGRYDQHTTCPEDRKVFGAMFEADATTVKMYVGGDGTNPRLIVMTKM